MAPSVKDGGLPVSRVDFFVDATVVCSDATAPYGCFWKVQRWRTLAKF